VAAAYIMNAIIWLIRIMQYAIFARVIISWFPISRENQIIRLLYQITEPILEPIRNIIQRSAFGRNMMLDFSPLIAFFILGLIQTLVFQLFMYLL